jgi:hypothetical protein
MKHRMIWVSSLLALAAACGGRSTEAEGESSDETIALARIALRSSLPSCGASTAGAVYYVVQDQQLVYCDGNSHQDVELDFTSTWLVSAGTAASCAHGGSMLSAGPDRNSNRRLDPAEIVASAMACNHSTAAQGTGGSGGAQGTGGTGGAVGISGSGGTTSTTGPQGHAGSSGATNPTGEDLPCTSAADCAGLQASFCDLFVSHTCLVSDCSVTPDSCSAGKECCDLSAFGLPTLCIAAGACTTP